MKVRKKKRWRKRKRQRHKGKYREALEKNITFQASK